MHRPIALAQLRQAITLVLAIIFLALGLSTTAPTPAAARGGDADFSEFYEALEPYGDWIEHRRYGYVWAPHTAEDDEWRPYTRGYWAPTEEHGWYWVSDEPFGWAVYHYGRWIDDDELGWVWIPGHEWAPAWVAWRDSDDYVGWAPLPPEARWEGDRLVFSADYYEQPRFSHYWIFAAPRYFGAPGMHRHILPRARSVSLLPRSRIVTHYHFSERRIFNRGIDPRDIERRGRGPITILRVLPGQSRHDHGLHRGDRGSIVAYRPTFRPSPTTTIAPRVFLPSDRRPDFVRRDSGGGDQNRDNRRGDWRRGDWRGDRSNESVSSGGRPVFRPTDPPSGERREQQLRRGDGERRDFGRSFDGRQDGNRGDGNRGDGNRWRDQRSGQTSGSGGSPTAPTNNPAVINQSSKPAGQSQSSSIQSSPPAAAVQKIETTPKPSTTNRQVGAPTEARSERGRGGQTSGGQGSGQSAGSGGGNRSAAAGGGGGGQQGGGNRPKDGEKKKKPPVE